MKKYLCLLVTLAVTLFVSISFAFSPPPAPQKGWYVSDQTGRMTSAQINQLNQKIERVSRATKNEFGILLLQDMGGDNIEDVANATFKAWGIGKRGLDNGCLIVVALKERKSRIETGKGVEGEVTDLQANDILKKNLNPHLARGDFAGGFNDTLDALSSLIESRHNQKAEPPPPKAADPVSTPAPARTGGGCDVTGTGDNVTGTIALVIVGFVFILMALRAVSRHLANKEKERFRQKELEWAAQEEERLERARIANEQRARQMEEDARRRKAEAARQRVLEEERRKSMSPPPVPKPPVRSVSVAPPRPAPPPPPVRIAAPVAATVVASAAVLEAERLEQERLARQRREREEEDDRRERARREERAREEREENERRRRQQEDDDRRRRERDEEDRRRRDSESSSSFWDSGSSSGGGFDSGGGFGGGDSGGGGSSSDW